MLGFMISHKRAKRGIREEEKPKRDTKAGYSIANSASYKAAYT
jgi:hypothetical protein